MTNSRNSNVWWSLVFVTIRLILCIRYFTTFSLAAWFFALSELLALYFTVEQMRFAKWDLSHFSKMAPICYMTPLLFQPASNVNMTWTMVAILLSVCQVFLRAYMGREVTVGVPKFGRLISTGPYRFVRHPLTTLEICLCISLTGAHESLWNVTCLMFIIPCLILAALIEERFLFQMAEYCNYARKVRYRFIPRTV